MPNAPRQQAHGLQVGDLSQVPCIVFNEPLKHYKNAKLLVRVTGMWAQEQMQEERNIEARALHIPLWHTKDFVMILGL